MNKLIHWYPFRELEAMQDRVMKAMNVRHLKRATEGQQSITTAEWSPIVDIIESEKDYVIKAELPEVKLADLKISAENGTLTIKGERKLVQEETSNQYHRIERSYGVFMRSFTLPEDVKAENIKAELKDGLLVVQMEKSEINKPKQIEIKIS